MFLHYSDCDELKYNVVHLDIQILLLIHRYIHLIQDVHMLQCL